MSQGLAADVVTQIEAAAAAAAEESGDESAAAESETVEDSRQPPLETQTAVAVIEVAVEAPEVAAVAVRSTNQGTLACYP